MIPKTRPTSTPELRRGWSQARQPPDEGLTLGRNCGCAVPIAWTAAGLVAVWRGKEKHLGGSLVAAQAALNRMKCPRCGKMARRKPAKRPRQGSLPLAPGRQS